MGARVGAWRMIIQGRMMSSTMAAKISLLRIGPQNVSAFLAMREMAKNSLKQGAMFPYDGGADFWDDNEEPAPAIGQ